jgi:hypothetical protein
MCLRPSDAQHSMLSRRRIALARRQYIVIVLSAAFEIAVETMGRAASLAKHVAHFRHRILSSVQHQGSLNIARAG